MGATKDEQMLAYTFETAVPDILGAQRIPGKTFLGNIKTLKDWRDSKGHTGVGVYLDRYLATVVAEIGALRDQELADFEILRVAAEREVNTALRFVEDWVHWWEDFDKELDNAGNLETDCLEILSQISRAIFKECLATARSTAVSARFDSNTDSTTAIVLRVLRCNRASGVLSDKRIREHPIVYGACAKWLVSNC